MRKKLLRGRGSGVLMPGQRSQDKKGRWTELSFSSHGD
jgi:hypothetical protein